MHRNNNLFNIISFLLFAPETLIDAGTTGELSVDDMIDELSKDDSLGDDKKPEDLLTDDKKEPVKEEKKEELELEEEEPVIDETDVRDVPRKEILAKYPTLFKEFPQLETAYYREKKYAEIFPTIDDAKEAVEKVENYDNFEQSLLGGNLDGVLNSLKTSNPKSFARAVDNYLPSLQKADQGAYYHVIGGILKNTIATLVREGTTTENDNLKAAAVVLNQFLFGSSEFKAPTTFSGEKPGGDPEQEKVNNERSALVQEKFESSLEDLSTVSDNIIKSTISQHIDPKGAMTDYVKRTAIKDAIEDVKDAINGDARFKSVLDKLWEKAFEKNFSKETKDNIKKAYLNKAKTLLPQIISRRRNEALKGLGKRVNEEREEPQKKGPVPVGRASAGDSSRNKEAVPKGMSTLDFLNSE